MTDCQHDCAPDACALHGPAAAPVDFAAARERFRREATRGVCDTGRYRMPYFAWGAGPPLVLIHGLSDTPESFVQPAARLSGHPFWKTNTWGQRE